MEFKFKISEPNSEFKYPYSGAKIKYANILKRFLQSVYTIDPFKLKFNNYIQLKQAQNDTLSKITHKDVFKVYQDLIH